MLRQVQWYIIQDIDQNDKNPNNFIIVIKIPKISNII